MDGVVSVDSGLLRGALEDSVWVFRGVPYARDVSGHGRWRLPEPPAGWLGARDALVWGPLAPQSPPTPGLSIPGDPSEASENCLNLNVWTPALDDGSRPVMVWVHGGRFTTGSGSSAIFRGDRLARTGDVVVVTFNYRLGALGFLGHPALGEGEVPGCANWGLWDQVAALEWVRANISEFGGDPDNVTVFGESAGAMSIAALLASPVCGTLFHRAVIQSGPPASASLPWAQHRAQRVHELAGLRGGFSRREVRGLSAEDLVRANELLSEELPRQSELPFPLLPVVDGGFLDRPPPESFCDGATREIPLLLGTTRDEAAFFVETDPTVQALELEGVVQRVARVVPRDSACQVVESYRQARAARGEPHGARDVWSAIVGDYVFRLPTAELARVSRAHQPATFAYLFTWCSPFLDGVFGSPHGLEIPFVFGTLNEQAVAPFTGSGPDARALSESMQRAWCAFARTGDPSCDELGEWPAYDEADRATMVLGPGAGIELDPRREERLAWQEAEVRIDAGHHHDLEG